VRTAAARGLGRMLELAAPPQRVETISAWASAEDAHQRASVARALCSPTPMFITDMVIEQLAADISPDVRCAALEAAKEHMSEDRALYAAIAQNLLLDPDPRVRDSARRALG